MSPVKKAISPRAIVDDVLGRAMTREIWSGNYDKVLPVSVQDFDLTAVLPAVFYMFRFAHRRGKGEFFEIFGGDEGTIKERRKAATIERVASKLVHGEQFEGFEDEAERAILGDLLLCFCLENTKRALGRTEQVQRVAPVHYMSSWVDLPSRVTNLRYVPEMMVAMLADQKAHYVGQCSEGDQTWFAVGGGFENNVLLRAFHQGVVRKGQLSSRTSDQFEEDAEVGLDQLLMIRVAQQLGAAPDKMRGAGGEKISNQRPIAEQAARHFSEDIRRFVRSYAGAVPRHAFVELMESSMAIGLTTIVTSVIELMFDWADTGELQKNCNQEPTHLFVDCSNGVNRRLRGLAEQSMDDFMRRIERFPVVLMALRLLDHGARYDRKLKNLKIETRPYATEWVNLLGELLHERRDEFKHIIYGLECKAEELADRFEEEYPEAANMLRNDRVQPNPVWRIAETLTSLQGRSNTQQKLISLVDSCLMMARPNGLARKRTVMRKLTSGETSKRRDVRSLVFTDSVLDYLVHLLVLRKGSNSGYRPLSFGNFVKIINERFGFCIDVAPNGMTISNDLLQENRAVLERRLRDLGLLIGVNDADSMKYLKPRFEYSEGDSNDMD
jgi:hypothetical protein